MQQNPFTELEKRLESIESKLSAIAARPAPQPEGQEKYLTIDETCKLLSVSRPTLWAWDKKGILQSVRLGNLRRYRMSDIQAIVDKQLDKKQGHE